MPNVKPSPLELTAHYSVFRWAIDTLCALLYNLHSKKVSNDNGQDGYERVMLGTVNLEDGLDEATF